MEKEFVNYELTKKLNDLGIEIENIYGKFLQFTEYVSYDFYKKGDVVLNEGSPIKISSSLIEWPNSKILCYAYLYQQVFDWFREEHHIIGNIYSTASGFEWEYHYDKTRGGSSIKMSDDDGDCEFSGAYTTYEKAREGLINSIIKYVNK